MCVGLARCTPTALTINCSGCHLLACKVYTEKRQSYALKANAWIEHFNVNYTFVFVPHLPAVPGNSTVDYDCPYAEVEVNVLLIQVEDVEDQSPICMCSLA